jgi:hypothetical protein
MAGWRDIRGAMENHANILYHWFNQRYKTPDRTIPKLNHPILLRPSLARFERVSPLTLSMGIAADLGIALVTSK